MPGLIGEDRAGFERQGAQKGDFRMNIGAIGTPNYYSGYHNNKAVQKAGTKSFGNTVVNNTSNIVIHGLMGEKTEAGDTVVGAWGNAITGTSTTVYKPQSFDENNPVYYMKIWDKDGNVTERTVNLNEIDPQNCNSFDMYAYCCYANDSGKSSSAMTNFMGSHAHYQGELGGGSDHEDLFKKTDWLAVVKNIMDMQYQLGNMKGYMDYKNFFDFLRGK